MCYWEFESRPIHTPFFLRKSCPFMYQSPWFSVKFGPKTNQSSQNVCFLLTFFDKNYIILLKYVPIWNKFLKILKNGPIHIPKFVKKKGVIDFLLQWGWFGYPCFRHIPIPTFVPSTPQIVVIHHKGAYPILWDLEWIGVQTTDQDDPLLFSTSLVTF